MIISIKENWVRPKPKVANWGPQAASGLHPAILNLSTSSQVKKTLSKSLPPKIGFHQAGKSAWFSACSILLQTELTSLWSIFPLEAFILYWAPARMAVVL